MKNLLILLALSPFIALSQDAKDEKPTFKTITIGNQVWMVDNLNIDHFRNGDLIAEIKDAKKWQNTEPKGKPAWCYFNNDPTLGEKYGKQYNWSAVNDPRGLAPDGWHIPTDAEWKILSDYLGGEDVAGVKMKSTSGWAAEGNGTDESGFNGISCGARDHTGSFAPHKPSYFTYWWSATEYNATLAWYRYLSFNYSVLSWDYGEKKHGFYVRCVKD